MMLKVIARTIGLHRLILLNFYPFLQKYIQVHNLNYPLNVYSLKSWVATVLVSQPHQRDVTSLLAAAVQACHDMVSWLFFPCPPLTFYVLKVLVTIVQITYDEWAGSSWCGSTTVQTTSESICTWSLTSRGVTSLMICVSIFFIIGLTMSLITCFLQAIAVGLNVTRELCLRIPLVTT